MLYSVDPKHTKIDTSNGMHSSRLADVIEVNVGDIVLGQVVRPLDRIKLKQIQASIRDQGLLQPIHLYRLKDPHQGKFGLAAGQHRLRAMRNLGHLTIPAFIVSRQEAKVWQWSENLHRSDLRALELSEAIVGYATEREHLSDVEPALPRGGRQPSDKGYKKLAKALRFDRTRIAEAYQHVALPNSVKERIRKTQALNKRSILKAVAAIEGEKEQLKFLKETKSGDDRIVNKPKPRSKRESSGAKPARSKSGRLGLSAILGSVKLLRSKWKKSTFRKLFDEQPVTARKQFVRETLL